MECNMSFLGKRRYSVFVVLTSLFFFSSGQADVLSPTEAADIHEPAGTYNTSPPTVLNMQVDTVIGSGACVTGNYAGCTLNDILNDINGSDDFKPEIKVHMTADDFPDDGLVSNATLRQRGATSRLVAQKSFRVKLDSKDHLWRGERRIQLIKAMYDFTRVRNKLSYDLFSEIPHLPSMRSQFVHFTINDQGNSEDYGFYTHVEHFGKEYLVRRGWDKDSRVYKVELFNFDNEPALAINPTTGKPVDKKAFEKVLEIKRGKKHFALAQMVKDVNDPSVDFNTQIMGKYFNRDNYLTWFAVNILLNNADTNFHNYYLFNPKSNDHFYLVPWDYDLSFGQTLDDPSEPIDDFPRWWFGIGNWWESKLHRRFLREPGNLDLLKAAVLEIKNKYLTPEKIRAKTDAYYNLVFPILTQQAPDYINVPDWDYIYVQGNTNPERIADFNRVFSNLADNVNFNYARFMERVNDPMPFWVDVPTFLSNHRIQFQWTASESLTNQNIVYELQFATNKEFKPGTIIRTVPNIASLRHTITWAHPKGTYYYRVIARDAANPQQHWQEASNGDGFTYAGSGLEIYGVQQMYVSEDGIGNPPPPPPPSGVISNPVSSISINGDTSDWNGLTAFPSDPNDILGGSTNIIDWQSVTMAHSASQVYLLYKNHGAISNPSYLPWGWSGYMDTDNNPTTGYPFSDTVGADYLVMGSGLYRYNGSGTDWKWTRIRNVNTKISNNNVELSFPRSALGSTSSIKVVFYGVNEAYGGSTTDYYPDNANQPFVYSFGGTPPPNVNHLPVAVDKSWSLMVNTTINLALEASDPDAGDTLSMSIVQQPAHGTLAVSGGSLHVSYTPDANYTGTDSFRFKVTDSHQASSNIATVSFTINAQPPANSAISNPVVAGGISIDGRRSDWNSLTLFEDDADDVNTNASNPVNWRRAGIAHSQDKVYMMFENNGPVEPTSQSGQYLEWGWVVLLDTDNNPATGYKGLGALGAEYMMQNNSIYKYAGSGSNWKWINQGDVTLKYRNNIAELSFPRSLVYLHQIIKVSFYGANEAWGGNTSDSYPDTGAFEYDFGPGQYANRALPMPVPENSIAYANNNEPTIQPVSDSSGGEDSDQGGAGKGGSFGWFFLIGTSLLFVRRKRNCNSGF